MVSIIMENPELYTPSGLWHVVTSVKEIVQNNHNISPTVCIKYQIVKMCINNVGLWE